MNTTIPIVDLLQSEWFSTDALLMEDEAPQDVPAPDTTSGSTASSMLNGKVDARRQNENAVRVALVLAKSYVEYHKTHSQHHPFENTAPAPIQLNNVFVTLANNNIISDENSKESVLLSSTNESASLEQSTQSSACNHQSNALTNQHPKRKGRQLQAGFFSSFDGDGEDAYQELFVEASGDEVIDENGFGIGMGYFSQAQHASGSNAESNIIKNQPTFATGKPPHDKPNVFVNAEISKIAQNECKTKNIHQRTLRRIEIFSLTETNNMQLQQQQHQHNHLNEETTKIHNLGCLIYSVFSRGRPPPSQYMTSPYTELSNISIGNNNFGAGEERRSKSQRPSGINLFSQLVESNAYPTSICRLLSDMVDIGPKGRADDPFKCTNDIIQDLEQMISHPNDFLHDDPLAAGTTPSLPLFGQRYHGRTAEVTKLLEIPTRLEAIGTIKRAEAIFVAGSAGSGKTYIVQQVGTFLSCLGWIVVREKFERRLEHQSQGIVFSLFDKLVANLVTMQTSGNQADVEYSCRAANAISNSLDSSALSSLADYIPSIHGLIHGIRKKKTISSDAEMHNWKLVFLLSRLVGAILSQERFIMIHLDDLQWGDATALGLIGEILISVGNDHANTHRFLLVGTYRDNEIIDGHPFIRQCMHLCQNESVNITLVNLSSFSKEDVVVMISTELRIPNRLVSEFADIVHKKTSGHMLFVVELLNSFVRNSTISYSLKKRRFDWNWNIVCCLKTGDGVASVIISNLASMQPDALQSLRVISCFGIQSQISLLHLLDGSSQAPRGGIDSSLSYLVKVGIIERAGPLVMFSHDLIQEQVYENIPFQQRQYLHYNIGTFLGSNTSIDTPSSQIEAIEAGVEQIYLSGGGNRVDSILSTCSLMSIATDQINHAGPEFIHDLSQRRRFAAWNMRVGKEATEHSNFGPALHYYKTGIRFLEGQLWLDASYKLCIELHEGAAFALLALGDAKGVTQYANIIIDNVTFEDSLPVQVLFVRSLESSGKNKESVAKGLELLRKLTFDFPSAPTPLLVKESMIATETVASQYNINQILAMRKRTFSAHQLNVFKLFDALTVTTYRLSSPYLPLMAFAMVRYSLQNQLLVAETAVAFSVFGFFKLTLQGDYKQGEYWGQVALKILEQSNVQSVVDVRARWLIFGHLMFWFTPLKQSVRNLRKTCELGMKLGDVTNAMFTLGLQQQFSLFEGENLSLLSHSYDESLKKMIKYNVEAAKMSIIYKIMIDQLMGESSNPFSIFNGSIKDEESLLDDAQSKNNTNQMEHIHLRRFFSSFWFRDYASAEVFSKAALSLPSSKRPKLVSIFHTFFRGLIAFHRYRESGGTEYLDEGIEVIDKVKLWLQYSPSNFESKLSLLKAELFASTHKIDEAKAHYEASIKSARDNGRINEQGLAYEFMGYFLSMYVTEFEHTLQCFKNANTCYMAWGALEKANQIRNDHGLDLIDVELDQNTFKHTRDWT